MNRFKTRLPVSCLLAAMVTLISGCGTGQVAQTANQEPAVNGNRVTFNNVALRDVRIQAPQTGDAIDKGKTVELVLVAVNQSPDQADRLVGITSDVGTVTVAGDPRLPAGGMLFVGTPEGQNVAPGPAEANSSGTAKATISLNQPISNGLTYKFTFIFETAGQGSVLVPISAGLASQQG
ncbi:MAG: hypothetical protein JO236_01200 [Mycobacterium sp.]|uniref:hypothetical protein n=1 Tax=Mycobacterium sp. TaxID=1785 RepID=UPI001ECB4095|nr:hypothetical protein [Mycobacterium sp.]